MRKQFKAFLAEVTKNRHSPIIWVTFIAFSLGPIFGGVFMYLMLNDGYEGLSGAMQSKAIMLSFETNWKFFFSFLSQAVGVGGVFVFGFSASWIFGREYSDGTAKDILALPISPARIINAKFIYYIIWCLGLALFNLLLGLVIASILQLPGWSSELFIDFIQTYLLVTLMIVSLNTPIAFFALYGKGYLAPLGIVALTLVMAQILAALGFGPYFPWAVPGIYSGSGGAEMYSQLNAYSYILLVLVSIAGYLATLLWWKYTDH